MSIYHCTQCGTNYGPNGSCPSCGRIGSRVSEFKMEPPKTFEAEILAAHPESNPNNPLAHEHWDLAMKLVGERHEKAELVRLVNWLVFARHQLSIRAASGALDSERLSKLQYHGNRMLKWGVKWTTEGQTGLALIQAPGNLFDSPRDAIDRYMQDTEGRFEEQERKRKGQP